MFQEIHPEIPLVPTETKEEKPETASENQAVYLECVEGNSSKFWEAQLDGLSIVVRYGRIGTKGTDSSKSFSNAQEAQQELERLIQSKLKKGYVKK